MDGYAVDIDLKGTGKSPVEVGFAVSKAKDDRTPQERMVAALNWIEQAPLVIRTAPVLEMDGGQLFQFCQLNRGLRIERSAEGDLIIMAPASGSSGRGNARLTRLLDIWAENDGRGQVFNFETAVERG